ncbi:MAG: ABC transporter permease [Gammaproteobacteria bacterium]|nr:ABC transporter permease [Gammaproteobacteria bacterium]
MSEQTTKPVLEIVIEPQPRWGLKDLRELAQYVDLLYFLVWRTIKVAYAQTVGGIAWALIQPAFQVLVFSLFFGGLLNVEPDGGVPYILFSTVAVIPWTYMSATMSSASSSLVGNAGMLSKIYFPRIIYPLVPVIFNLVTFFISLILVAAVMIYYDVQPTRQMVFLPVFFLLMIITPLSVGLWLASLAIRFRDVQIVMGYFMRMAIYLVPVMYPTETVPDEVRSLYILNPFVGVIEGFNACLLGKPLYMDSLLTSAVISTVLLLTGLFYFKRMERVIVDVV